MDSHPVPEQRRVRLQAAIRIVDLIVYMGAFLSGTALLIAPFAQIPETLDNHPVLVGLWTAFLLGGGLIGFLGRLTRFWMVETPATVSAAAGALIYVVVLVPYAIQNVFAALTLAFAIATLGFMVRRWLELQIFGSEPNTKFGQRLELALRRRTANAVKRTS